MNKLVIDGKEIEISQETVDNLKRELGIKSTGRVERGVNFYYADYENYVMSTSECGVKQDDLALQVYSI